MSGLMKWEVLRDHEGDRHYAEGETRIGTVGELGHLEPRTLRRIGKAKAGEKTEPENLNKAVSAAPANKANNGRKATDGHVVIRRE